MKKAYRKYFFASIKRDFARIIAIISIVALGVSFLIGLVSSTPDLYASVSKFMNQVNYYDINIKSSAGFSDETINKVKNEYKDQAIINDSKQLETKVMVNNVAYYAKVIYQPMNVNLKLESGTFPQEKNQCVILSGNPSLYDDFIDLTIDENIDYKVVGKVIDPTYFSKGDVTSSLNSRKFDAIIYLDDSFDNDIVDNLVTTDIWIRYHTINHSNYFSNKYEKQLDKVKDELSDFCSMDNLIITNCKEVIENQIIKTTKQNLEKQGLDEEKINQYISSDIFKNMASEQIEKIYQENYSKNNPEFYYLTYHEVAALESFTINAEKVNLVASIFPVFFFAIAMLVSLSSFGRMVSKDKMEIATLKSNGYSNGKIYQKYLLIGILSTIIGSVLGLVIGILLLPYIIYNMYYTLFIMPSIVFTIPFAYVSVIVGMMVILISLVAFFVVRSYNKKTVAELLLSRNEQVGKKILLERVPWIWNHLKFKTKSMFRNIFKFKKNLLMMILGVGGCSAILLTGFGLSDSINVLTKKQYQEIFKFNLIIETPTQKIDEIDQQIEIIYHENNYLEDESEYPFTLVSGDEALNQMITFTNSKGKNIYFDSSSCFITNQIAENNHLKVNQQINVKIGSNHYQFIISDIVTNYVGNYLYLGSDYMVDEWSDYHHIMGINDFSEVDENAWYESVYNKYEIKNCIFNSRYLQVYDYLIDNLKSIVFLLIFISGLLALIVVYNLVDINMNERIKELATLRVLGYQKREVVMYIFREIFVMSVLGFLVGILFGIGLHRFVISAISSPGIEFEIRIQLLSYLYSGLLTVLFSLIVVFVFAPKILKINMSEALKISE